MHIYYGICGEGLGHTGRSLVIVKRLMDEGHKVTIFTYGDAFKYLCEYADPHYFTPFNEIPGLKFATKGSAVDLWGTLRGFVKFRRTLDEAVTRYAALGKEENVGLVISDFEPVTARVAKLLDVPLITIDNQHRFLRRQPHLPLFLKTYCFFVGCYLRWLVPHSDLSIISAFHNDTDGTRGKFKIVGPIVKDKIAKATPVTKDFILVYIKSYMAEKVLRVLENFDDEHFVVYGVGPFAARNNIIVKQISDEEFTQDLIDCKAVIASAGNQLLGEATFLGKPVFAIPVPNQHEQNVNAFYLMYESLGDSCHLNQFSSERLADFIYNRYEKVNPVNGADQVMKLLKPYLSA